MRVSISGCELFPATPIRTDDISKANATLYMPALKSDAAILFLIKKDEMDVERKLIRRRERRHRKSSYPALYRTRKKRTHVFEDERGDGVRKKQICTELTKNVCEGCDKNVYSFAVLEKIQIKLPRAVLASN